MRLEDLARLRFAISPLGETVTCTSGTISGEVTGTGSGSERIVLSGCEASGEPCQSQGANSVPSGSAGVIDTNLLATRLVGPDSGQVYVQLLSAQHQPYLAEFACHGPLARVIGSLAGLQAGNVGISGTASSTHFEAGDGEQALAAELSEDGGIEWLGPDAATLTAVAENTAASQTEIKP